MSNPGQNRGSPRGYPSPRPGQGYGQSGPIVTQPGRGQGGPSSWMNIPQKIPNCPPGLEYLNTIDTLLIHQKIELLEIFTGYETQNRYIIKNILGQKVYYAEEDSNWLSRNCCGHIRPFEMGIFDNYGNEIIHLDRPFACDSCWCPCCLQKMEVSSSSGTILGTIEQKWSLCFPNYAIKDYSGETVLFIKGPFCTSNCCGADVDFNLLSSDGNVQVGKISKQWAGFIQEAFTDADNFGITFPMDLDVRIKAVLLGACFLIDFMFYENNI